MPNTFKSLVLLLALPFVLAGCKINSINYFPPTPANVRIVNVLYPPTPVDVTANSVAAWSGLAFEGMTGYQEFTNTSTKFSVTLAGTSVALIDQTYNLAGNQSYTLVIYGSTLAPQMGPMADVTQQPPNGKSDINLLMAAPTSNGTALGLYPIDIYFLPQGQAIDTTSPTFTSVNYTNSNIFGSFTSGPYQLVMTVAATKTIIYDSGPITLPNQTATDVIVYSRGSSMLTNVLLNEIDGASQQIIANNKLARLKVVNSALQSGPVNQFLNGNPGISNLAYQAASAYQYIQAGTGTVTFEATSAPGATIATLSNSFGPATDNTVFVTGFAGATTAVALNDNNSPPLGGYAAVRFVNSSPNSPPLNIFVSGTPRGATALATNAATSEVQLTPGAATFTFFDSTNSTLVLTLTSVPLVSGQSSTIYVQGAAGTLSGLVTLDTP